ncbi:cilia- and flagella-associated protein 119-like [Ciona intestinalis]
METAAVNLPTVPKPSLCVWSDLSVHNMDELAKCSSTTETRKLLANIFNLGNNARGNILLDLYMNSLKFAKTQNFSKEQSSAYFSIVKKTHEVCVSTPFGNLESCFAFFRELVLTHGVHRPPWSLEIFNTAQIAAVTSQIVDTYFRHFKMYKYTFTPKVRLDLTLQYDGLPPTPPPEEETPIQRDSEEQIPEIDVSVSPEAVQGAKEEIAPEEPVQKDENLSELESIVRKAVSLQLKQMHATVERQLEDTDKAINEKIQNLEGGHGTPKGRKSKSPKGSPKGKRKA